MARKKLYPRRNPYTFQRKRPKPLRPRKMLVNRSRKRA